MTFGGFYVDLNFFWFLKNVSMSQGGEGVVYQQVVLLAKYKNQISVRNFFFLISYWNFDENRIKRNN